jgi:hypothetical protein
VAALPLLGKFQAQATHFAASPAPQTEDVDCYQMNEAETRLAFIALVAIKTAEEAFDRLVDARSPGTPLGDEAEYQYCGAAYLLSHARAWLESNMPGWAASLVNQHMPTDHKDEDLAGVAVTIARAIDE